MPAEGPVNRCCAVPIFAEAAPFAEATEERYAEAESLRLRGDLLNATGDQTGGRVALSSGHRRGRAAEREAFAIAGFEQPRPALVRPGQARGSP